VAARRDRAGRWDGANGAPPLDHRSPNPSPPGAPGPDDAPVTRRSHVAIAGLVPLLAAGALALGAAPAHAAVTQGSWQTPTERQSVSGVVPLRFASNATSVTFELPGGEQQTATVSGGVASGSWNSAASADGQQTLTARECDLSGCDDVSVDVELHNGPARPGDPYYAAPPTVTPASGTRLSRGQQVTFSSADASTALSGYFSVDGFRSTLFEEPSPYAYTVPTLGAGSHLIAFHLCSYVNPGLCTDATYPEDEPYPAPTVLALDAPTRFFPHHDGYQDAFAVTVTVDLPGKATLVLVKGSKVVAHVTKPVQPRTVTRLSTGGGLEPGRYGWYVTLTGASGKSGRTAMHSVTADKRVARLRHLHSTVSAASLPHKLSHGSCAEAADSGGRVLLHGSASCPAGSAQGVAVALFFPDLRAPGRNGYTTLTVSSTGTGELLLLRSATDHVVSATPLTGHTSIKVPNSALSPTAANQLQFLLGTDRTLTVTGITLAADALVLS